MTCIFVDHGMLRKNEFKNVLHDYECLGLNVVVWNKKQSCVFFRKTFEFLKLKIKKPLVYSQMEKIC